MIQSLEILYVGSGHEEAARDLEGRGARILPVGSVYDAIVRLKRTTMGATVVELPRLGASPKEALEELRTAAEGRPVFVFMSPEDWDRLRGEGVFPQEDVLLHPLYPEELWRRLERNALPPPSAAAIHFRSEAARLKALVEDVQMLLRLNHHVPRIAERLVRIVEKRLAAARVSVFLSNPSAAPGELTLEHAVGLDRGLRGHVRCRLGEGIAGSLAQKRQVVLVQKAGRDGPAAKRTYKTDSYLIAPLHHHGEVLGILCATERIDSSEFDDRDTAYLEALGEAASPILSNAFQYRVADELATIDPLTGLFNRRYFDRVLPQEVQRARRYDHALTLAMIDVDNFKAYNDFHGHQAGDRALATIARVLRDSFRQSDILVRYGGEEFTVLMPETTREPGNGVESLDRARRRVRETGLVFEMDGVPRPLTISGGVASWRREPEESPEQLLKRADDLLYRAKNSGRDRVLGD